MPLRAYFWGLAFAVLFYYGFPVWWWRYGLRNTMQLLGICVVLVVAIQTILRVTGAIEVDNFGESMAVGLIIAIPIRVIAGFWVAKYDAKWRRAILLQRKARMQAVDT
tara:strand:- start:64 stop:387 length:324 start_codon:yes stop_codon:yes gene_type:complete